MRELTRLARPERRLFSGLVALTTIGELGLVPGPFLFAWIIGRVADRDLPVGDSELAVFAVASLFLYAFQGGIATWRARLNRQFALKAANRLRCEFFGHLLALPYRHFLEHNAGGQANSYLNDIDDIDSSISGLVEQGIRSAVLILFFGIAILLWNPIVGALALLMFPMTVLLQRRLRQNVARSSRDKVDLREELVGRVSEAIQNVSVVKSFTLEDRVLDGLERTSTDFRDADVVMETYQSALRSSASVLLIFTQYSFFIFGAWLVTIGELGIGAFLGQVLLVGRLTGPLNSLLEYLNLLTQSQAALGRVRETLALAPEGAGCPRRHIGEVDAARFAIEASAPLITVRDLHFRHRPELPLFEGWNFDVHAGQKVALVGPSGSGKTTLFHLLLGLFDDYGGEIRLAGHELRELELSALRSQIGVVFQEQILFNASVRDNLTLGLPEGAHVTNARLREVLELAHAREFVDELTDGLDSIIGVGGVRLSGGQRQRLAIARVLLKNPPILLLDEATSALDSFSEQHVERALESVLSGRTSLVIAHRLSTITAADRILVIDDGRIIERGSHSELLAKGGVYARLFDAQVRGFIDWATLDEDDSTEGSEPTRRRGTRPDEAIGSQRGGA